MTKPTIDDFPEFLDGENYSPAMHAQNPEKEAVPDELTKLLSDLDQVKEFSVTVQRITETGREHCGKMVNVLPDTEEIGIKYGPGKYRLTISWPVPGKKTPMTKPLEIQIGKEYSIRHKQYLSEQNKNIEQTGNGGSDNFAFMLDAASKMVGLMRPPQNDNSILLEVFRTQNDNTSKMIERLERTMTDDRKENAAKFDRVLSSMENMISRTLERKEKPLLEQIQEIKTLGGMLGMSVGGVPMIDGPEDDRPDWMKAIDLIGDKLGPLLSAFAQGGLKGAVAATKAAPALNSELGQKILNDARERVLFMTGMLDKATTKEQRLGVVKMAEKLKINLPPDLLARATA